MTHEFKTPLSSILLASNYLKNNKNSHEEKIEQYANMIHSQGLKLNQHIETLLRVAKSDSSQIDLQKSWINLNDLVIEIKFDIQLRHPQITLNSDIKPSLSVYADAFHLKNILTNFVDNAIKYNTDHVRVTLSAKETSKGLEIACIDNGIGIEKTHLPYIFDNFYRIPRENNKDIIGFGLGLFYSKKMANLHFWQIKAENESTNGLKIYLLLSKKDYKYE
jgi:two-component system phosphate regulon sensor histidine kinase PhoR